MTDRKYVHQGGEFPPVGIKDMYNAFLRDCNEELSAVLDELETLTAYHRAVYNEEIKPYGNDIDKVPPNVMNKLAETMKKRTALNKKANKLRKQQKVDKKLYREVLIDLNLAIIDAILDGWSFDMGFRLGRLCVVKRKMRRDNLIINWGATKKLEKETGIRKHVYYTDSVMYVWAWIKKHCMVRNRSVYSFRAATSGSRKDCARNLLVKKLKNEEFASLNFRFAKYA